VLCEETEGAVFFALRSELHQGRGAKNKALEHFLCSKKFEVFVFVNFLNPCSEFDALTCEVNIGLGKMALKKLRSEPSEP
jgi:hypothetical protein